MKRTDIALIIVIASLSVMAAFFVANSLPFLKVSSTGEKVKTTEVVTTQKVEPDTKIFREDAINPTVETVIGGN